MTQRRAEHAHPHITLGVRGCAGALQQHACMLQNPPKQRAAECTPRKHGMLGDNEGTWQTTVWVAAVLGLLRVGSCISAGCWEGYTSVLALVRCAEYAYMPAPRTRAPWLWVHCVWQLCSLFMRCGAALCLR
jgi:hypothetical protein